MNFAVVTDQVKTIQRLLEGAGWVVANAVGEQTSPDGVVWFSAGYAYGEYTVTASYRPRGAGPAEGVTRVRVTPALVQAHPNVGRRLAEDLITTADEAAHAKASGRGGIEDVAWPPAAWEDLAR